MYENFRNTKYRLDGSKYFLDNVERILESENPNLPELNYNLEAFYFFIKAVGSTFHRDLKNAKNKFKIYDVTKNKKIKSIVLEHKTIIDSDEAVKFLFDKRHESKSKRTGPDTTFSIIEEIEGKTITHDVKLKYSPRTGEIIEIVQAGRILKFKYSDWPDEKSALEVCKIVYARMEINVINAIDSINYILEN